VSGRGVSPLSCIHRSPDGDLHQRLVISSLLIELDLSLSALPVVSLVEPSCSVLSSMY